MVTNFSNLGFWIAVLTKLFGYELNQDYDIRDMKRLSELKFRITDQSAPNDPNPPM